MVNTMKMPIFKGMGTKDPEQFLFVTYAIWKAQQITDEKNEESVATHSATR